MKRVKLTKKMRETMRRVMRLKVAKRVLPRRRRFSVMGMGHGTDWEDRD